MSECNHSRENCEAQKINWSCDHEDGPCVSCVCAGIARLRTLLTAREAALSKAEVEMKDWKDRAYEAATQSAENNRRAEKAEAALNEAVREWLVVYEDGNRMDTTEPTSQDGEK